MRLITITFVLVDATAPGWHFPLLLCPTNSFNAVNSADSARLEEGASTSETSSRLRITRKPYSGYFELLPSCSSVYSPPAYDDVDCT